MTSLHVSVIRVWARMKNNLKSLGHFSSSVIWQETLAHVKCEMREEVMAVLTAARRTIALKCALHKAAILANQWLRSREKPVWRERKPQL